MVEISLLRLDSSGLLADSEQSHLIGTYEYVSEGPDGRLNYRQNENFQKYLYYYTGFGFNVSLRRSENTNITGPVETPNFGNVWVFVHLIFGLRIT